MTNADDRSPVDPSALLLWPGAGADRDHRGLVALAEALAPFPVQRYDFPYRQAGRRAPGKPAESIAAIGAAVDEFSQHQGVDPSTLVLGGRSYGGRMCSLAVAEGLAVAGLVLLSYPLHPPGKPDRLRVEHFGALSVPCLFVSGRRDPFGTPEELTRETAAIAGPVTLRWVDGAHDPRRDPEVAALVGDWLQ